MNRLKSFLHKSSVYSIILNKIRYRYTPQLVICGQSRKAVNIANYLHIFYIRKSINN